jgi:O-antigen/teichoic acid export membrane protein
LGAARFGVLTLVWMLVGYFCIFDLGLGRALTRMAAERLGAGRDDEVPGLFWTSLVMMIGIGSAGSALLAVVAPWLVNDVLTIEPELRAEALTSFRIVCLGLPVVITTMGLIGMLEAQHRFALINLVRVPMGAFTFLGPVCVLPFSRSLPAVVAVLIAGRVIEWLVYFVSCLAVVPGLGRPRFHRCLVGPLLGFGGWMTVSTIAMPVMVHIDRFLIGSVVSVAAAAFYATPAEIVVKLLIFPRALVSVLFPSFSAHLQREPAATARLYSRSIKYLLLACFPLALGVVALAYEGLLVWLGPVYAARSAPVMRWLAAGIFVYSLAYVPYSLIQGAGYPRMTALLHLAELPLYLLVAPMLIRRAGIVGAAAAWFIRVNIETVVMFWMAHRFVPAGIGAVRRAGGIAVLGLALLLVVSILGSPWARLAVALAGGGMLAMLAWRRMLDPEERSELLSGLSALCRRGRAAS